MDPKKLNIPGKIKNHISKNKTILYEVTTKRSTQFLRDDIENIEGKKVE